MEYGVRISLTIEADDEDQVRHIIAKLLGPSREVTSFDIENGPDEITEDEYEDEEDDDEVLPEDEVVPEDPVEED